ncbi:hypothetical protein ACJX0J_022794, partial [Zea mays]
RTMTTYFTKYILMILLDATFTNKLSTHIYMYTKYIIRDIALWNLSRVIPL